MIRTILTLFFFCARVSAESEEELDAYYGVPLGALYHSADRTKAEMYAADEFTVIFNHFSHSPTKPGCTSIMIGPPRSSDKNTIENAGVLIPITQPLLTPRSKMRTKRSSPFNLFHGLNWPTEFAHLRMDPKSVVHHQNYEPEDAFAGIELHMGSSLDEPTAKDVNVDEFPVQDAASIKQHPNEEAQPVTKMEEIGEQSAVKTARTGAADKVFPSTSIPKASASTTQRPGAKTNALPKAKAYSADTTAPFKPALSVSTTTLPYSSSFHQATKPIIFFDTKTQSEMGKSREKIETEGPGIVVFNSDRITPRPRSVHPSFYGPLARSKEDEEHKSTAPPTKSPFARDVITDDGYIAYFGGPQSEATTDWPRRAPSHRNFGERADYANGVYDKASYESKVWTTTSLATTTPRTETGSTPLFYVIEDPHAERRKLRAERSKKNDKQQQVRKQQHAVPTHTDELKSTTEATTTTDRNLKHFDRKYELPVVQDKTIAFTLTNGASLTDYDWIGLYNQCEEKAIPLISLKGIDPPREEKIAPLSGWKHNISSYRVQLLNCNTILIPGFVYNTTLAPKGTFIYIGIGQFPDAIEKQVKATIVGQQGNELVKNYGLEDIMIRLPKNYRTFDIDFISVYNEVEQQAYAHVVVPSLLVPPCSDEV